MLFPRKTFSFVSQLCALSVSVVALSGTPACAQVPGVPSTNVNTSTPAAQPAPSFILNGKVTTDVAPAEKLLAEGKYAEAENLYRELLTHNPSDLPATAGLGLALANQFKLDGATQLLERVIVQDPNNSLAYAGRATVTLNRLQSSNGLVRSEKDSLLKAAEEYARQACTLQPAGAEAHYTLGNVLKEQGRLKEAVAEYRSAVTFDPHLSFAFSALGNIELDQNSLGEAKADFTQAIALNSANSTAHYGMGAVYLKEGKTDEAIKELNTSLSLFANSWPTRMALGQAYHLQGNTAAALQQYKLSTLIKPENSEPYLHMAEIHVERGDLEVGLADLQGGLTQDPHNIGLRLHIAQLKLRLDKADDAIKGFRTVLQMSPNNPDALKGLTHALYLKAQKVATSAVFGANDYEGAFKAIDEAIKINPNDMELLLAKAKLMTMAGQKPDLTAMQQPSNEAETVAYAAGLQTAGEFAKGSALLKTVVDAQPNAKQAFALADIAVLMRDLDNAQAAYNKGLALSGTPARGQRGLAQVAQLKKAALEDYVVATELLKKKEYDGSIVKFRSSLGDNPTLADARLGLAQALEKATKVNSVMLTDAVTQYHYYLALKSDLPGKDREKITNECTKLAEKSFKLKEKETKKNINL